MSKYVVNFAGYPIYLSQGNKIASEKELNYLRKINQNFAKNKKPFKLSKGSHILEDKQLKNIKKIILYSFEDYKNNVLQINNSFYICNSWSTSQKKGEFHHTHVHPNHIFSAVYYAKAKKCSLVFYLDRSRIQENFNFSYDIKEYNVYNSGSWRIDVNAGDVIIFPGHLRHESALCEVDERIVVGSSFFIKGKLGSQDSYNDINLKV